MPILTRLQTPDKPYRLALSFLYSVHRQGNNSPENFSILTFLFFFLTLTRNFLLVIHSYITNRSHLSTQFPAISLGVIYKTYTILDISNTPRTGNK